MMMMRGGTATRGPWSMCDVDRSAWVRETRRTGQTDNSSLWSLAHVQLVHVCYMCHILSVLLHARPGQRWPLITLVSAGLWYCSTVLRIIL